MAKVAKTVGLIAGVVALSIALPGVGTAIGLSAATAATVASVATAVAAVANVAAAALQKKPELKGSVSQVVIGMNMPIPCLVGRTYAGGMQVYDDSGGSENKYRFQVMVVSAAGPIDSFESFEADYSTISFGVDEEANGWYEDHLFRTERLGERPETAMVDVGTAMPGFGTSHKMSGYAGYRVTMKFDKDGKRFASGVPQFGVIAKGVKIYDPRLDDTYPGGAGSHRWDDESTFAWSDNPALHALAYARGRYIEKDAAGVALATPVRVLGVGLRDMADAIDIAQFVELANLCDANGWTVGGTVYEGPGISKWDNLKRFLHAAAAQPVWARGQLGLKISAPRPSLFTLDADDLADGTVEVRAMKGWRDRKNSIVPKYREEDHKWEYVQADAVTATTYLAEDGELKSEEVQFDLVQDVDQAAQLAAYEMVNGREFGPITVSCKPRLLAYRVGEAGTIHLPEAGLSNQLAVIVARSVDPATGVVTLTFESETSDKHAYALGLIGTAPPTPTIRTPQELDEAAAAEGTAATAIAIAQSYTRGMTITTASGGDVTISAHERVYSDGAVAIDGAVIATGATDGTSGFIYYEDQARAGGAVTFVWEASPPATSDDAGPTPEHPYRHLVGRATIAMDATEPPGKPTPPWWKLGDEGFIKFTSIETAADVTSAIEGLRTVTVQYDHTGTVLDGELPRDVAYRLFRNGVEVTSGVAWSATNVSGTNSATISGTGAGTLNLTSLTTDSVKRVQAVYNGTTRVFDVSLMRSLAVVPTGGEAGNPGTVATDTSIAQTTGSSYGSANAGPLTATAGSAGEVVLTAPLSFQRSTAGTGEAFGKWQWRIPAGVWADVATEIENSADSLRNLVDPDLDQDGYLDATMTKTGLTSGTDYEFQLLLRSGGSYTVNYTGTAAATGQ